jgi:hypothetical protein
MKSSALERWLSKERSLSEISKLADLQGELEAVFNRAIERYEDIGWTIILALPVDAEKVETWCSNTLDTRFIAQVLEKYHNSQPLDIPAEIS